mgnify:CR=1 FL=1
MATKHEELLDTIGNMTVLELSEFVKEFEEKFGVTAAAPVAAAAPAAGGAAGAAWPVARKLAAVAGRPGDCAAVAAC